MSELEREFNPNPSSEVEAAVETRDPSLLLPSQLIPNQAINSKPEGYLELLQSSLLLPSQLIPNQAINSEPMGYLELLQSSIGEREFNPNPSSEVEAVSGGDIDASGDEIAPGEEYGSPREGAPYGVVTIRVEAVTQDVDASGDEIAPGEEYGSPREGAPYGVVTIHRVEAVTEEVDASGDEIASGEEYGSPEEGAPWGTFTIRASGDIDTSGVVDPPEEDAPECRRTRRGMRLRSGRLI